jgi:hypothetical protein
MKEGPPQCEVPAPARKPAPALTELPTTATTTAADGCQGSEYAAGLRLRRGASWRLPVLDHSGRSDPWHYDEVPLTEHQADTWHATVDHLAGAGLVPLVSLEVRRELWRRGGRDRKLAERLHKGCAGAVA